MTAEIQLANRSLYDQDFNLWLSATAQKLREKRFDEIDLDNLIEEIESMGRSDRKAIKSFLRILLEHLLKITYWESERGYNLNHWLDEIFNFRYEIADSLEDSPSLKNYLIEVFEPTYQQATKKVEARLKFKVPKESPFTLEQVLDPDWFPIDIEEDDINA